MSHKSSKWGSVDKVSAGTVRGLLAGVVRDMRALTDPELEEARTAEQEALASDPVVSELIEKMIEAQKKIEALEEARISAINEIERKSGMSRNSLASVLGYADAEHYRDIITDKLLVAWGVDALDNLTDKEVPWAMLLAQLLRINVSVENRDAGYTPAQAAKITADVLVIANDLRAEVKRARKAKKAKKS